MSRPPLSTALSVRAHRFDALTEALSLLGHVILLRSSSRLHRA